MPDETGTHANVSPEGALAHATSAALAGLAMVRLSNHRALPCADDYAR